MTKMGIALNYALALLPLLPSFLLLSTLIDVNFSSTANIQTRTLQLFAYVSLAILGFYLTNQLVPHIKLYTLKRGIGGKDLGKKGTALGENLMCVKQL